jgi:hypothetical protein
MMKILVSSVSVGQFEVNCTPNTKVEKLKEEIVQLVNKKGVELPQENNLIFKGKLMDCSKTISELGIADNDPILLLYNLKLAIKLVQSEPEKIDVVGKIEILPEEPKKEEKIENLEPAKVVQEPIPELAEANFSAEQLERIAMVASQIDWNEFPMPNPEDLERLMETGFSKWRCQKALLLNRFDPEAALDWLCCNLDDPTIDDPISTIKLAQIIMEVSRHANDGPQENNQTELIAEAVRNNKCTYTVTGKTFVQQKWFFCYTCGFVDSEGVCEGCANTCHKGHSLSAPRGVEYGSGFFCDCGSGDSCICNK